MMTDTGRLTLFVAISLLVLTGVVAVIASVPAQRDDDVKIVAHRGAMSERPENTLAAFGHAIELGADIVELDIRTSSDGRLFILHDADLDRTTDASGRASDLTLEELQALDAGSWFDPIFASERIPSLREALEWARGAEIPLLLDLKESGPEFAEAVAAEVRETGMVERVVLGVRSPEQAREFRSLLPESSILAFMRSPEDIEAYAAAEADVIRLWLRWLDDDPTLAQRVRDVNLKLMVNGTDGHLDEARALMGHRPDWILIDDIAQLRQSLVALE